MAALAFEITQPGFGFAGFAGVGMLGLAAYGLWVVPPTSWLGMALLLGGIGLLTLDVRLRKLGPLSAAGLDRVRRRLGARLVGRRRRRSASRPG